MAALLSYALCTVADVKETLNIDSGDNSKNNLIIRQINRATEMIEKYTDRRFASTTYTDEEYDATNTDQLVLKNRPIITFTSLSARDTSLNENDWETIDSELYFADTSAGVLDLLFTASGRWNRYKATYTAGYATIPSDLAEACVSLAAFYIDNPTSGQGIKRKEEGQRRVEYFDTKSSSTDVFDQLGLDDILKPYMNYPVNADK